MINTLSPSWFANPLKVNSHIDDCAKELILSIKHNLPNIQPNDRARYYQCAQFVVPYLMSLGRPLKNYTALEIGCGTGSKSLCLSSLFNRYIGIDMNQEFLQQAQDRKTKMSCNNLDFINVEATHLKSFLNKLNCQVDVIFLYAVIEHLTIEERIETLQICWEYLKEEGILYIGEAPNRLCPVDHHSSFLPFFDSLPDQLALKYAKFSKRDNFSQDLLESQQPTIALYRRGRGCSFHEFELGIMTTENIIHHIFCDNYSNYIVNMNPIRKYEINLLHQFSHLPIHSTSTGKNVIPPMFSRYWLDAVFYKSKVETNLCTNGNITFVQPNEGSVYKTWMDRRFFNQIYSLYGKEGCLIFSIPENSDCFTFGLKREKSHGKIEVLDSKSNTILCENIDRIKEKFFDYWNPYMYITIPLKKNEANIQLRSKQESYICIATPYFR